MARLPLTGGAYASASLIGAAQRCMNLFPESIPQSEGEPAPVTHLPTPGLREVGRGGFGAWRAGAYRTTKGDLYAVNDAQLLRINSDFTCSQVALLSSSVGPVSMTDNGVDLVVVDGTGHGLFVALDTGIATPISDQAFYGADRVDFIGTAFVFNRPGTRQWYLGNSIARTFDPLYIANMGGRQEFVRSLAVVSSNLWLFGTDHTEIWTFSGAPDFPLQELPGSGVEYGCIAPHSLGRTDQAVFWLSRSKDGLGIILEGSSYRAKRVSHHGVEVAIASYGDVSDAIGTTRYQGGHTFYVLTFPSADRTWAYDLATEQWHEWLSCDADGAEHRHRAAFMAGAFGQVIAGDCQDGRLYAVDPAVFTEGAVPIRRQRSFPHAMRAGNRVSHKMFEADIQCGTIPSTASATPPQVWLDWSYDRGASFGNPVARSLGGTGQRQTLPTWRRLGIARDRVWRLTWDAPTFAPLNGAFVTSSSSAT